MCGVVGVAGVKNAASLMHLMLFALQHRGQEGAKIVTLDKDKKQFVYGGLGLVDDIFNEKNIGALAGSYGAGHNRYSTTGDNDINNLHPLCARKGHGKNMERICVAHNGTLTSEITGLRMSETDTEQILGNFRDVNDSLPIHRRIFQALKNVEGAFALIFLFQDVKGKNHLIALRDPHGIRPLCIGRYKDGYLVASESCAFDIIEGAEFWRFVKPGEMVIFSDDKDKPFSFQPKAWRDFKRSFCSFEEVYLSYPSSRTETADGSIAFFSEVHESLGQELACENPDVTGDVVVAVPNSAIYHARGFSKKKKIPSEPGIIRSHYIPRTFIDPDNKNGNIVVKLLKKFRFIYAILFGKSLILVDDSIVRGNTMRRLIILMKNFVKKIVSITCMIASPPTKFPCFLGVDTPTKGELAINKFKDSEGVRNHIQVDTLRYLSLKGMLRAICRVTRFKENDFCAACFSGNYPVKIDREDFLEELSK
ncbi:MAG: amidophosphoribosyltransferase [bacterium]|nr:amidophosphoribosyltransferase [bacterium]